MYLPRAAGLLVAALMSATGVLADVKGVPTPPVFTAEEMDIINRDARLIDAVNNQPWRLRCAFDAWEDTGQAASPPDAAVQPETCAETPADTGRASNEGALDLLKILKEAAGQGKRRRR